MFVICFENEDGTNTWELVSGEDAMQFRVNELVELGQEADAILAFNIESQI